MDNQANPRRLVHPLFRKLSPTMSSKHFSGARPLCSLGKSPVEASDKATASGGSCNPQQPMASALPLTDASDLTQGHSAVSARASAADSSASGTAPKRTQLLVSVQSVSEAQLALDCGVDWIDLKNPSAGALGAPTPDTARKVAAVLGNTTQRSVALGEWQDLNLAQAIELSSLYPFAKLGLAGCARQADLEESFTELAHSLPAKLVPVLYADHEQCAAPGMMSVLEIARRAAAPFLLIDTFYKDGRRLGDWLTHAQLQQFVSLAAGVGIQIVLAGSLSRADVTGLLALAPAPAAIAVRGAVCSGPRTADLCADRLRDWVQLIRQCQPLKEYSANSPGAEVPKQVASFPTEEDVHSRG